MTNRIPVTIAFGDGIGPEIMTATLKILKAAQAPLEFHPVEIGEKVYLQGHPSGIAKETWETILKTKNFLKAPITTPQGGGFKSLNVTIRTLLGLYANIRPCIAYAPFIATKHPLMDVVIIRENEEDLYTGIEYRQTPKTCHALKIMSRSGCEKIVRYAFEYAVTYGRKKVTCFTKDNILKMTDGLFHQVFKEISLEYPTIESEHWIIDIGAAKLADTPLNFDVVVMPNLYGDILSDVAAQIAGSVGLAGSANIGVGGAMFEAIHGSAPRRAGQNLANPSGLILASIMMLEHLQLFNVAKQIRNGWLSTIEEGIHTYDIFKEGVSKQKVSTSDFTQAIIDRLGKAPKQLRESQVKETKRVSFSKNPPSSLRSSEKKITVGVDVFIQSSLNVDELQKTLSTLNAEGWQLILIANRGVKVWPEVISSSPCTDNWRCRFMAKKKGDAVSHGQIVQLLKKMAEVNLDFIHTENLCHFAGKAGYSLSDEEQ